MPHRGRLNVLAAVMGKPYHAIFHEFQGGSSRRTTSGGSGDVKYHLGASSDREFDGNNVHLSLTANPSHLEIVNPVVLGKRAPSKPSSDRTGRHRARDARARSCRCSCTAMRPSRAGRRRRMLRAVGPARLPHRRHDPLHRQQPDRLHDRAALLALLALSVGRALMVQAPIFHVNGDDPEAVVYAAKVATEFRRSSTRTSSSTCSAIAASATTKATTRSFTQPLMYEDPRPAVDAASSTARS
jgi:2-oxoglutarate dehydrogenase E1 component